MTRRLTAVAATLISDILGSWSPGDASINDAQERTTLPELTSRDRDFLMELSTDSIISGYEYSELRLTTPTDCVEAVSVINGRERTTRLHRVLNTAPHDFLRSVEQDLVRNGWHVNPMQFGVRIRPRASGMQKRVTLTTEA